MDELNPWIHRLFGPRNKRHPRLIRQEFHLRQGANFDRHRLSPLVVTKPERHPDSNGVVEETHKEYIIYIYSFYTMIYHMNSNQLYKKPRGVRKASLMSHDDSNKFELAFQ